MNLAKFDAVVFQCKDAIANNSSVCKAINDCCKIADKNGCEIVLSKITHKVSSPRDNFNKLFNDISTTYGLKVRVLDNPKMNNMLLDLGSVM